MEKMQEMATRYVCWEMENGHMHGFVTDCERWEDDGDVPGAIWDGTEIATQGDYAREVARSETTQMCRVREYPYTDAGLREAVEAGDLEILNPSGGFVDLDDEGDMAEIAETGGLAAWADRYGIEVP